MPMKAAVVKSNSNIEIKNIEKPPIGPGDMLVKMRACEFVVLTWKKYLENMDSHL